MKAEIRDALKRLPSVDEAVRALAQQSDEPWPRWALVQAVRDQIAVQRGMILSGQCDCAELDPTEVTKRVRSLLLPSLRPVINATGVVLHTNLGRAPLGSMVLERICQVAAGYSNLEYLLEQRRRGNRHDHAADLLRELCGAEDALVVNNNAAAVLLCLMVLANQREVVVSRGELIEIGGSFRLPDVMAASGAILREVGTTNRTHPSDYDQAIDEATALLLKAHRSNFDLVGFTAEVQPEELVAIGRAHGIPTMYDLGSGCLMDLDSELTVPRAVRCGFDLVTFSGDKLLGGPQAGVIVGRAEVVERLKRHPLMRALRPDKMTLAGLEATLEAYRDGEAASRLPAMAMLTASADKLKRRASRLRSRLRRSVPEPWGFELRGVESRVGGGALPRASLPSWAVTVEHPELGADAIEPALRRTEPPVIARIEEDRLLLDVRTVADEQVPVLVEAVTCACASHSQEG